MSHIDSIAPAGPVTLAPGGSVDVDVLVSGVPGDDTGSLRFSASDGSLVSVNVVIDRADLQGILTGSPTASQVLGEAVNLPGSVSSVGPITGGWRFRFTAA